MNALMVCPESFSDSNLLIELLNTPGTKETVTKILEATSRAVCSIVSTEALRHGVSAEQLKDSELTLKMHFEMPTAEDLFDPSTHVEVMRV